MGKLLGEEVGVSGVENTLVLVSNRDRVKRRDEAVPCLNIESNIQREINSFFTSRMPSLMENLTTEASQGGYKFWTVLQR